MTGDPRHIRVLSRLLRAEAERVRAIAITAGRTREVVWRSTAAHAFRARVGDLVTGLHRTAGDLEGAAVALDVHAGALEAVRAAVARAASLLETAVRDTAADATAGRR